MKVLYALDSLNRGGAETHVLDVCRNANAAGVDMVFVAFGGGAYEEDFRTGEFEFLRFDRSAPIDLRLVRRLRRLFTDRKIEIAHGFQPIEMIHLYLSAIGTNVKCVQTHQGFLAGRKNRIAARLITPLVDSNISVSRSLLPWLESDLGLNTKRFSVVHNTVNEERLIPSKTVREGFGDPELLCGMVANFLPTPTKDQLTVCKSLPRVFDRFEKASFVFVGKVSEGADRYYEECRSYCRHKGIADRVIFAGGRNDVPDILNSLDLFVFSSLAEGLPVSVIEAMLVGVPLIVSDIGPLLEVTDKGRCARVFERKDPDQLAEAMIALLGDRKLRNELGRSGNEFASRNFGIKAHFERLTEVYRGLLNK